MNRCCCCRGTFYARKRDSFPLFFGLVWKTIISVRDGTFDLFLLKPRSVLHMIIVHSFDTEDIGKFFVGAIVFGYAAAYVQVVSYLRWVEFSMLFLVALGVLFACAMIMSGDRHQVCQELAAIRDNGKHLGSGDVSIRDKVSRRTSLSHLPCPCWPSRIYPLRYYLM